MGLWMRNMYGKGDTKLQSQYYSSLAFISFIIISILLLLISSSFHRTFAASPTFNLQVIPDQRNDWVQTYGNDSTHLKSDFAELLQTDYLSDGKTLQATLWLASNLQNASAYHQSFKKISYGMLVRVASSSINHGYNGADYDFYVEVVNGKWSQYLYQLSSTGAYVLIYSKINYSEPFGGPEVGHGYVKLKLNLSSINYSSNYGILFYTAESYKSNEVRDFSSWLDIPPSPVKISTFPNNIVVRQGEQQLISADIFKEPRLYSNNVTNLTFNIPGKNSNSDFNSSGLHVSIQRIQPPLFKVVASPQTPLGIYTVPFTTSLGITTTVTPTKPIFINTASGFVDPEFMISKKYPTTGYVTNPFMNLTITVAPPLNLTDEFKGFWIVYGLPISIIAGGFTGGFASLIFDRFKKPRGKAI
jgi:hypothetical protein